MRPERKIRAIRLATDLCLLVIVLTLSRSALQAQAFFFRRRSEADELLGNTGGRSRQTVSPHRRSNLRDLQRSGRWTSALAGDSECYAG